MKLTPTQQEALKTAVECGALIRWKGGFWTFPAAAIARRDPSMHGGTIAVPEWHVGIGTIQALQTRGLLKVTAVDSERKFWVAVGPTDQGKEVAHGLRN